MGDLSDTRIRVIKAGEVTWEEAMTGSEEADPPGQEFTAAMSADDKFSFGLWKRDVQRRHFERPYHEVAYIIEGEVEVTDDDGEVHVAGPGDILITPQGQQGLLEEPHAGEEGVGHLRRGRRRPQRVHRTRGVLSETAGGAAQAPPRTAAGDAGRRQRTVTTKRSTPRPPSSSVTHSVTVQRRPRGLAKRCDSRNVLPARRRSACRAVPSP